MYQWIIRWVILCDFIPCFEVNLFWQRSLENGFSPVCSTQVDQWIICGLYLMYQWIICGPSLMYQWIIRCVILCDFIPCFEVNLFWQRSQENGISPVCSTLVDQWIKCGLSLIYQWIICGYSLMFQRIIRCVILCDFIPCFEVNLFWQRSQENGFSLVFLHSWINESYVDCHSVINESYVDCHSVINESYVNLHSCINESFDVSSCVTSSLVLR